MKEVRGPVSQFGPVFTLPLRTAPFMNTSVTAVFDEQGRPLELGLVSAAVALDDCEHSRALRVLGGQPIREKSIEQLLWIVSLADARG